MSFRLYKNENSEIPATEFIPCDDITINVGTALCLNGGHAVLATGTNKPTHISISNQTVAADGTPVPVFRVKEGMIFESVLSDANTGIAVGTKYTIDASGEKVTATETSGVAEVVSYDGTAAGSKVRIRF